MDVKLPITHLDEMVEQLKKDDIVVLYAHSWICESMSYHGVDHMIGFYQGNDDRLIVISQSQEETLFTLPLDDLDYIKVVRPSSHNLDIGSFQEEKHLEDNFNDGMLFYRPDGQKVVGFYMRHGVLGKDLPREDFDDEDTPEDKPLVRLCCARKLSYLDQMKDYCLSDFNKFEVVDKCVAEPAEDVIDCHMLCDFDGW
jgi:hypothetical protein